MIGDLGRVLLDEFGQLAEQRLGQGGRYDIPAEHDGHVHAQVALPHLSQALARLDRNDDGTDDALA